MEFIYRETDECIVKHVMLHAYKPLEIRQFLILHCITSTWQGHRWCDVMQEKIVDQERDKLATSFMDWPTWSLVREHKQSWETSLLQSGFSTDTIWQPLSAKTLNAFTRLKKTADVITFLCNFLCMTSFVAQKT